MKHFALLILLGLCSAVYCRPGHYTTKYDNIDLDAIIRNDRLMKNYVDCLMERKKCTPDGAELKRNIPDALQNDCADCTKVQKDGSKKILTHMIKNKRDWYLEVEAKYDPTHIFRKQHEEEIKKEGVSL